MDKLKIEVNTNVGLALAIQLRSTNSIQFIFQIKYAIIC